MTVGGDGVEALAGVVRTLPSGVSVVTHGDMTASLEVRPERVPVSQVIATISAQVPIADISVREPEMEGIIRGIYEAREVIQ